MFYKTKKEKKEEKVVFDGQWIQHMSVYSSDTSWSYPRIRNTREPPIWSLLIGIIKISPH